MLHFLYEDNQEGSLKREGQGTRTARFTEPMYQASQGALEYDQADPEERTEGRIQANNNGTLLQQTCYRKES